MINIDTHFLPEARHVDFMTAIKERSWFAYATNHDAFRAVSNLLCTAPICPRPLGFGLTHIPTWKLFHLADREKTDQLQSSRYSSDGEQQFIDKKENTVLVQIEFRYYWRMWSNISPFWSIPCWFVVMILGCANTTWPVLSGCETINFCYMTRAIIHDVHDHEFETSWF